MIIDRWPTDRAASQESETILRGKKLGIEIVETHGGAVHVFLQDSTDAGVTYRVALNAHDVTDLYRKLTERVEKKGA